MRNVVRGLLVVVIPVIAACSGSDSTGASATGRLVVQLATRAMGPSGSPAAADVTVTKGADVVVISSVQLVARKIELERVDATCPAPAAAPATDAESEGEEDDSPECPDLKLGPLLLTPPLGAGAQTTFSVDVPVGTYKQVRLQIHRPTSDPSDAAFLTANPGFMGVSIKVTGTFNGTPFTFTTDLTTEVEMELKTPIDVKTAGPTDITIFMDVTGWFLAEGGSSLVSPLSLTLEGRERIEQNIRRSFRAFEDENRDGEEDGD
jgi:hypothetical protein